ncbi:MAG TPA: hypothetical protein VEA40_12530, partial [Ramlibacter sp.]|nr:hypothetical protein [Ramlibacter sp.]
PVPDKADRPTFNTRAYDFQVWQKEKEGPEMAAMAAAAYANALEAEAAAVLATQGIANFKGDWSGAVSYAQGEAVSSGGAFWLSKQNANLNHAPAEDSWWTQVGLAGNATGQIGLKTGASIASAATLNLSAATGNRVHVTGTTTITAVTLARGPVTVIFDGALTLTHHATNCNLPGAANITTAAGDRAVFESDGATVYCSSYTKANGQAVAGGEAQFGAQGVTAVVAALSSGVAAICSVSDTRGFVFYRGTSGWPTVALIDETGAVLATKQLEAIPASTSYKPQIVKVNATTAAVTWVNSTPAARACVVSFAGAVISQGAVLNVIASPSCVSICRLSDSKVFLAVGTASACSGFAATIDAGTLALTNGAGVSLDGAATNVIRCAAYSADQVQVVFSTGASTLATRGAIVTVTGVACVASSVINLAIHGSSGTINYCDVASLSAGRVLVASGHGAAAGARGVSYVIEASGTGASAVMKMGRASPISPGDSTHGGHRLASLSASTVLHACVPQNTDLVLDAIQVLDAGTRESSSSLFIERTAANAYDLAVFGRSVLVAYCLSSDDYTRVRPIPLGTFT